MTQKTKHHNDKPAAHAGTPVTDPAKRITPARPVGHMPTYQDHRLKDGITFYPAAITHRRHKCAILGFTDHRQLTPWDDKDFERWGLNEMYRFHKVLDETKPDGKPVFHRWFEIHKREVIDPDKQHIEELKRFQIPVYMQQHYDDIPASVPFPKTEVEEFIADITGEPEAGRYMTSSIAWEIGLALLEGFREIHIYGVDMASETEYFEQRACVEYLIGIARGRGIKVHIPEQSDILMAVGQYAFGHTSDQFRLKIEERIAWLDRESEGWSAQLNALEEEFEEKSHQVQRQFDKQRRSIERQYTSKKEQIVASLRNIAGARQDCVYFMRSLSVKSATPASVGPTPDRSLDPMTGIAPSSGASAAPDNRKFDREGVLDLSGAAQPEGAPTGAPV